MVSIAVSLLSGNRIHRILCLLLVNLNAVKSFYNGGKDVRMMPLRSFCPQLPFSTRLLMGSGNIDLINRLVFFWYLLKREHLE